MTSSIPNVKLLGSTASPALSDDGASDLGASGIAMGGWAGGIGFWPAAKAAASNTPTNKRANIEYFLRLPLETGNLLVLYNVSLQHPAQSDSYNRSNNSPAWVAR